MPDGDRTNRPTEREMEDLLRSVGAATKYPPTPDVTRSVRDGISSGERSTLRRGWLSSPAARVAAALVVVLVLALPVVSVLRGYVISSGGSGGAAAPDGGVSERATDSGDEDLPDSAARTDAPQAAQAKLGVALGLDREIPLQEAARVYGDTLALLRENGNVDRPDEAYRVEDVIVLIYRARLGLPEIPDTGVGAVISYFPQRPASSYLDGQTEGRTYRRVEVGNGTGYWFPEGTEPEGQVGSTGDLPGGALVWERDGGTVMLRSELSESRMVGIAETLHQ